MMIEELRDLVRRYFQAVDAATDVDDYDPAFAEKRHRDMMTLENELRATVGWSTLELPTWRTKP